MTRAGAPSAAPGEPFAPGPTFAAPFHASGDPKSSPFYYGRYHNPTWSRFETALGELEGGAALAFASGMAALTAVFAAVLRPGDVVVLPSDSYYTGRNLASGWFTEMGVSVRLAPTKDGAQLEQLEGAKLLWIETPSNPRLEVCDLAVATARARETGTLVAVDNTTPTVLGQQPLAHGADFSVASDTKAFTGHSDLVLGHVACREEEWAEKIRQWRHQTGAIPGPMEVWLAHRSLMTLDLRLERQQRNALEIVRFLRGRPDVDSPRYPGLPEDPSHEVARRQMEYFGPVVSFSLESQERAEGFLEACELVHEATSFGGIHTTAERRARWGGDDVPEGFIRLSAGCEDAGDVIEDLERALDAAG